MFIVGSCGVEGTSFLPDATGALTTSGLAGMTTKAVSQLSAHAPNLTMLKQINWPQNVKSCGHAEGLCQAITAIVPGATGHGAYAGGMSADVAIGQAVNPTGVDPIILYSAAKGAYIADRISWRGAGADQLRTGDQNPYTLFSKLVGLTTTTSTGTTTTDPVAAELAATRKSVNDLVRAELNSLKNNSALSADDKARLDLHFQSIRDLEVGMGNAGMMCTQTGLDTTTLNSYKSSFSFKTDGMIETVTLMHMQLVALAFACNYNRVAALQWNALPNPYRQEHRQLDLSSDLPPDHERRCHRERSDREAGARRDRRAPHADVRERAGRFQRARPREQRPGDADVPHR
jgi:hypothetical protein